MIAQLACEYSGGPGVGRGPRCVAHGPAHQLAVRMRIIMKGSIFETCITPTLLYGCETWLLDSTSLSALESFQHEIGCRILRAPKFYSKASVRIALHWPTVATRILIRKLNFLSKLLRGNKDTISQRVFSSLAIDDIYDISIIQQCRVRI